MDGIAYAAIIFVCAAVGGGTPLVMRHRLRGPRIDRAVRLGTIFGGGVFLGSGFLHLLADAAGELNDVDGYPYAELYCCCGVLFPLCVDSVASIFASRAKLLTRTARRGAAGTDTDPDGVAFVGARPGADSLVSSLALFNEAAEPAPVVVEIAARSSPASEPRACRVPMSRVVPMVPTGDPGEEREGVHTAAAIEPAARRGRSAALSLVGAGVLFLSLTMHSFIAGLVLGVSGGEDGLGIFVAIIAHKVFAAWALGCALATAPGPFAARAAWLLGFTLATPTGVAVGMSLSTAAWVDSTVESSLVALAAGFFLYVGLMEIIAKELVDYQTKGAGWFASLKLLMLLLGFSLMAMLAIWV
mmetsp:Transcript_20481/g.66822  ORF Transcript_20481/g.66822 Transcript_20481/m.66822 type:complete len:358 (-) Transcript_20481:197-1270(-)